MLSSVRLRLYEPNLVNFPPAITYLTFMKANNITTEIIITEVLSN